MGTESSSLHQAWEEEVLARHRWGQHGADRATEEHRRLREFWDAIRPIDETTIRITDQIISLEICNWQLEDTILDLCDAIGSNKPVKFGTGHLASVSDDRWKQVWAYCLALRNWLPAKRKTGYGPLLNMLDPEQKVQRHIADLLGECNETKELYVERFCLCLEMWLGRFVPEDSADAVAHNAAVSKVEEEIKKRDPDSQILKAMQHDGDGRLQPCSHKAFRRYDIILSSIGIGKWRGAIPVCGTDGFGRAETLEPYLTAIEHWVKNEVANGMKNSIAEKITSLLGEWNNRKVFLASLLISLLRAQQLAAIKRAESRVKEQQIE